MDQAFPARRLLGAWRSARGTAHGAAAAALMIVGGALPTPATALTIVGNYTGGDFSAVPYFTCGADWNCADPASRSTPVTPTDEWVVRTFNAAARYWEQRIGDPWTVEVNYGFVPLTGRLAAAQGVTFPGSSVAGRLTSATIQFNSNVPD